MSRTNPTGKEVTSTGNEEAQYTSQAELIAVNIKSNSGIDLPQIDNRMVLGFFHRESLLSPFISGILTVSDSADFLNGNEKYSYPAIEVLSKPGTVFHYSGGGFLVLQHLIESFEKNDSIQNIMEPFLQKLGIAN